MCCISCIEENTDILKTFYLQLEGLKIHYRPSMVKVKADPRLEKFPTINSLEVLNTRYVGYMNSQPWTHFPDSVTNFSIAMFDNGKAPLNLSAAYPKVRILQICESFMFLCCVVAGGSYKPIDANLSQDLIILLSIGGVPSSYFRKLLRDALENIKNVLKDRKLAEKGTHTISLLAVVAIFFVTVSKHHH